ncbi:MAG: SRPBCC domain-containing protein [Pseudomonadota bacterium]
MSELPVYVLERTFDAPRELVWRTWTEEAFLSRWYGPGVETVIHKLDVSVGGLWLNEMKFGENSGYQRVEYTEVTPPSRLVWLHSMADADWNIATNPMMPDWPRVLLTTVTFEQAGTKTDMKLTWVPHDASEAEIACFAEAIAGMDKGWAAGMEIVAEILAELQIV